jgi:Icc-related predicted phosphoesterase
MLLQAAADFHGDFKKFQLFKAGVEKHSPDVIIIPGDVLDGIAQPLYGFLDDITVPVLISPGNMDTSMLKTAIQSTGAVDMNGRSIMIGDYTFVGVGPKSTDTVFCNIEKKTKAFPLDAMDVLISHIPPRGYMDKSMMGFRIGGKWVREIMTIQQPRLVICGHVHENPGFTTVNGTTILNCSVGKMGQYSLVKLDNDIEITMVGYPTQVYQP